MIVPFLSPRAGHWLIEVGLIALAGADAIGSLLTDDDHAITVFRSGVAAIAVLALFVRDRRPYSVFALTLPALVVADVTIASLIALCAVALYRQPDWRLMCCGAAEFIGYTALWNKEYRGVESIINTSYAVVFAAAPVWLGLLIRARQSLADQLNQIEVTRQHEHELLVERAVTLERSALAREMHDVVSHQVSLIAVQAGALQVTAADPESVHTARTIRVLAVRTLDELREMVDVLRPSGDRELQLTPQPGLADISTMVADSGITTTIETSWDAGVEPSSAVQRATYRAVQEGLTNVAKHAPGATAALQLHVTRARVRVALTNDAPTKTADPLPSAQQGLHGLRERAELLGGALTTEHLANGGFRLSMTLPTNAQHSPLAAFDRPASRLQRDRAAPGPAAEPAALREENAACAQPATFPGQYRGFRRRKDQTAD